MASVAPPVIRIHPADDVVIARTQLLGGTRIDSVGVTVAVGEQILHDRAESG